MNKVKLRNLFNVLALSDGQIATEIAKMTGQPMTRDLVTQAADGQPVTAIAADNICTWLSKQLGKEIKPDDISDLKIHPFSSLPASAANTEEGQQAMLVYLRTHGYTITPPALQEEELYEDGDYLKGELAPKNWRALSNRRVPWPKDLDPKLALHEMAPFLAYRLLSEQEAARGRDIRALVQPDEQV